MTMDYVIKTIELVKRYPTSARKAREGGHFHFHGRGGGIHSFGGILSVIKGTKGPFIEALRGVNLQVEKGETFGILDPNGAGKDV